MTEASNQSGSITCHGCCVPVVTWNRLRQSVGSPPGCRSFETHTLVKANGSAKKVLTDAFDSAEYVLEGIAEFTTVVPVLEAYCTTLMAEQSAHERRRLESWLKQAEVLS